MADDPTARGFWKRTDPTAQAFHIVGLGFVLLSLFAGWACLAHAGIVRGGLGIAVCLAGAIGGVANNFFRRLPKLLDHPPLPTISEGLPDTEKEAKEEEKRKMERALLLMTLQIYVSPLVGAMFALVLFITFMSGILEAAIFPKFDPRTYEDFLSFVEYAVPATNADAAMALFWSFVAGFLEQFVPNIIDPLAQKAKDTDSESQK